MGRVCDVDGVWLRSWLRVLGGCWPQRWRPKEQHSTKSELCVRLIMQYLKDKLRITSHRRSPTLRRLRR